MVTADDLSGVLCSAVGFHRLSETPPNVTSCAVDGTTIEAMPDPVFSVVIPVYNREQSVGEAIHSILSQRFRSFEIIVVDDGSTDGTLNALRQFGRLKVIQQSNAGPGAARNAGVAAAAGRYVAFLDSDDIWFPWSLEIYDTVIRMHGSPAIVTGTPWCFSDGPATDRPVESSPRTFAFQNYLNSNDEWRWYGVSSFVIRRDLFLASGGFMEGRVNGEDAELMLRLGLAPGFVHVAGPASFGYRVHNGNVTLDRLKTQEGLSLLIQGEKDGRFPGGSPLARQRALIISRHVRPFAVDCARNGNISTAIRLYREVLADSVRHCRLKFLAGLPLLALAGWLGRMFRRSRRIGGK